ncbi:MogA/MoaB family molybdenum cofactor biosynthesis protein [Natranaerofaba carboxydovora]|uniref:MogA/MoaB family molybdenum cofactor biosynthesis protein n=1 Tax=Natranaerofaba carboxydovora TaxID=2742683 RepID=UPI001F13AC01|nr:MogA/MoaB family molybdenum cofactor biosynthesis protein [Natranaerofaba carboxydovora]UMZ74553.1 Molybdopterin adenylyltransferase [Natranaerofaba carboxydovora]
MTFRAGILTLSDKGSKGEREDKSGKLIEKKLNELDIEVEEYRVLPDEEQEIIKVMCYLSDEKKVDIILTTGGTGLSPRDFTPEATLKIIEKEVPGIAEAMRYESIKKTPHGMLSRGVSGVRGKTLIINMPGSPKAVEECMDVIIPAIPHALETLSGQASECARE